MQAIAPPRVPTGQIQTFGELGPKYEVGRPIRQLENGDWIVAIVLIESGEEAEYPLAKINADPKAQ